MENDDEFGFKSLAQSFAPEVKAERKAEAPVPQPVPKPPVARTVAPPPIPEVKPEEVVASVPQQAVPPAPPIQNPVFDPEFQKAAGLTALAPVLAGLGLAGGAAYGYYKGRKSVQDRMMGQGLKAPEGALDTSRLDPEWQKILAQSERNRQVKQAEAMKNIQPIVQPETTNVAPKNTPPSIQGTLQPENSVKSVPSINNAQLQFGNENKIASMMANQEMRNPLGGLASAYTEPLRGAQIPSDIPTIADLTNQVTGKAGVEPPTTTTQLAAEAVAPTEGKKKGRPAGAKNMTEEEKIAKKGGLPGMTKQEAGMRGHLLGMYGGKENPAAHQAYEQVKEILGYTPAYEPGKGGSLKPEETSKIKGWQKENMPGPKITLTHEMKKILKAGGPAAVAAMVLTPEFANASTAEKRQILGEALLPLGISPSELQPGTLGEAQLRAFQEAQKLGSPYRSVPPPR